MALLKRLAEHDRPTLPFTLDGQPASGLLGDTLLTAVLTASDHVRSSDFSAEHRAGFCMMGACQDCWVRLGDGQRVRACSTLLEAGQTVSREPGRCLSGEPHS
ncbi:(2Fe-2S)-binding protein [Pseudomonas alliivorans]|nr:(2Fe-2S)-binding protein [Pseudomonas alliivorans]MEE4692510.1 (2Fe-2S)-binding protein [Pseudomonas alliivorans]MEE4697815.1 (2Fe-2S)-binding protein [Pseudomonas alliivorans]MEE4713803.1 (2Fe-2S)-binding protein [Pseudomonas alliivorans]MEE4728172.1 (2Fe-2S)-binding protein [Pseudomonas alliivorans]